MKTSVRHTTVVKEASKLSGCLKAEAEKKDAGSILMPPRTLTVHPQLELLWLLLHGAFENAEGRESFVIHHSKTLTGQALLILGQCNLES